MIGDLLAVDTKRREAKATTNISDLVNKGNRAPIQSVWE